MNQPLKPRRTGQQSPLPSEEIRYAIGRSSLGVVLVACSEKGVVSIMIGKRPEVLREDLELRYPAARVIRGDREDESLVQQVIACIEEPALGLDLPLDIRGTAFQKKVWQAVRQIPLGQTSSYTEIARKIGAPKAMRAVGSACANCKLALAIPCHRVWRSDGTFPGGIDWGTNRLDLLFRREAEAAATGQTDGKVGRRRGGRRGRME